MQRTVTAFNAITGHSLSEADGWLLMQVLKDVRDRQRTDPHKDSLEDCIAYAALKAEARLKESVTVPVVNISGCQVRIHEGNINLSETSDGWIPYDGKGMPVDGDVSVLIKTQNMCHPKIVTKAKALDWNWTGALHDITHYKLA